MPRFIKYIFLFYVVVFFVVVLENSGHSLIS